MAVQRTPEQQRKWEQERLFPAIAIAASVGPLLIIIILMIIVNSHHHASTPQPPLWTPQPQLVQTRCADGWYSTSTGPGTCSWHGGEAP